MNKELVISANESDIQLALLEDKQLVELHKDKSGNKVRVGDIYVGKVRKIMPGLNAAFIDVGEEKDGFVHYLDLGTNFNSVAKYLKLAMNGDNSVATLKGFKTEPILEKTGNLSNVLKVGQLVLAQVAKEPISTKGPKLSGDISFAGRYLVLTPFITRISISQKIKGSEERGRLRRLMQSIKPEGFGVIVRTVAEGKNVEELDADLRNLMSQWSTLTERLKTLTSPTKVLSELSTASALLRDVLTDDFNAIYVDNENVCNEIRQYIATVAPDKADIVHPYKMETPIFEQFGVMRDIRRAFGRIVTIRSGVYLYIEHTEAMHVIDVNSGNHIKSGTGQEDTALQVNIESAKEIARQLRLRDMGGIIIVDFVDMAKAEHRKELYEFMCQEMSHDKARHTILPLSKFGLMQITRQRVRPAMNVNVEETCPTCFGKGTIKSSILFTDTLESKIDTLVNKIGMRKFYLHVHPYVAAYINQGLFSLKMKWQMKYGLGVRVIPSQKLAFLQYEFYDADRQYIDMKEEIETK